MKLRIHGNSVRLRLGRSEVDRLLEAGRVQAHCAFGPGPEQRLWYVLEVSADVAEGHATLDGTTVLVTLPLREATRWASTDKVGIELQQDVGGGVTGEMLQLVIEKDFRCLHDSPDRRAEEDADAFPNPAVQG